jgi:predicted phage-related endonuclease
MRKSSLWIPPNDVDEPQGSEQWKRRRKACVVTASEFSAALGLCPWRSRAKLWRQKMGLEEEDSSNPAMEHGLMYEGEAAECYRWVMKEFTGKSLDLRTYSFATYTQDERFGGSPDRICVDYEANQSHLLEVKCTYPPRERTEVPLSHLVQMQGLLAIFTALPFADYVSYQADMSGGDNDSVFVARTDFSEELWFRHLLPGLETFASYVEKDTEPPRMSAKGKKELQEAIGSLAKPYSIF